MLVGFLECCECYLPRQLSCNSHICPHHVAAGVRWEKQDQGRVSLGLRLAVLPPHVDQRQRPQSGIWGPRGLLLGCLVAGSKSLVEACQMGRKGCRSLPALGEEALPGHSEPHAECQSASRVLWARSGLVPWEAVPMVFLQAVAVVHVYAGSKRARARVSEDKTNECELRPATSGQRPASTGDREFCPGWVGPWGDTCRDFSRHFPGPACQGGVAAWEAWRACQCLKCWRSDGSLDGSLRRGLQRCCSVGRGPSVPLISP